MRFRRRSKTHGRPPVAAVSVNPSLRGRDGDENLCVRIEELNHWYGTGELRKQVLHKNELELARGEIVIMTGPSGSGKNDAVDVDRARYARCRRGASRCWVTSWPGSIATP